MPSASSTPSSRPQTPTTSARTGSGSGGGGGGGASAGGGSGEKGSSGGGLASMTAATITSNDIIGSDGNVSVIGDGYFGQASSSKLTLDELKKRKLEEAHNRIDLLVKAHERDLQELCFALYRNDKFEMDGSPAIPAADDQFELTEQESTRFQDMLQTYNIRSGKSIKELDIPTLDEAREAILKDIARNRTLKLPIRARDLSIGHGRTSTSSSSGSNVAAPANTAQATALGENKIMPPPANTPIKGESLDRQKKITPLASPAIAVSLPLSAVPKMPAVNVVPKLPIPTDPLPLATAPPTSPLASPSSTSLNAPAATQAPGSPVQNQTQSSQGDAGSQADSQTIASQSTTLTVPNLNASQQSVLATPSSGAPISSSESPLHPTLQVLSPNPLSVTYASSLRPLPPDPFRRFTGVGVGGGAIHHRGHRKAPQLPAKNGVPPAAGPAGAGGVDLYKWAVRARASPGAGLVGKADKCLLTNDWKVAFTEQRFIRTMNKIEKLKSEGLWSFRQPKKQKGPVVRKAHWDHLLEELKWMQTDFKEERRWKIAVAFKLASAAREYVRAKSPQARARLTIRTRPVRHLEERDMEIDSKEEQVDDNAVNASEEDAPDVEEADADEDVAMKVDPKDKLTSLTEEDQDAVAEAVDDAVADIDVDADADADADGEEDAPGEDDMDAEGEDDDGEVEAATGLLVDNDKPDEPVEIVHKDLPPAHMPALAGDVNSKDQIASITSDPAQQGIKAESNNKNVTLTSEEIPINIAASIRAPIFSLGVIATTVSPVALLEHTDSNALAEMLGISSHELGDRITLDQLNLSALFPELPLFDAPAAPQSGKGDRRWDDGSLNQAPRLTHVSRLMDSKPVLVSTLQPARNRSHEKWKEDGEWNLAAQLADPSKGVPSDLLDVPPVPGSVLFTRKSNKTSRDTGHATTTVPLPAAPSNSEARATQFLWTSEEDDYLLSLIKQYGQHWQLISDLFNATRLSVPTDFREAWDCYDRYQRIQQAAAEGKAPPPPSFLTEKADDSKTNGSQNGQTNSLAMKREKLTKKVGLKYDGSRKKLRKSNITEVMKKCAKRRAETQQRSFAQPKQVNLQSHETHNQIKIGMTPSPQQLSLMKAERDEANARQIAMIQHQQRQAAQQAAAQAQQAAQQAAQQQQQQQATQQQQGSQSQAQTQPQTQVPASAPTPQQQLSAQQQHQQQLHAQQQRLMQQLQAQQQQQQQGRPQMPQQAQTAQQQSQPTQQQQQQAQQRFAQQATAGQTQQQGQTAQQQPNQQAINFAARPPANQAGRMPVNAAATANAQGGAQRPANATGGSSIPPQLAALQATLSQTLSNNPAFTPEQINTIALQLFRQAQQQGGLNNINLGTGVNASNNTASGAGQQQARPVAGAGQGQQQQQRPPAGQQAQGQNTQARPAPNTNGGGNKAQASTAANKQTKAQTPAKAQTSGAAANKSQPNVRPASNTAKPVSTTPGGSGTNAAPVNTAAIAAAVKAATAAGQKASGNSANANSQTASPSTPNATSSASNKFAQTKK
ncbi:hypothetical protein L7F22_042277 [Adiantum nelumboides]|nr:hypothetical protein [Adiantum nelumboides]